MADLLIDTLPLPQRLALAYAPSAVRPLTLALLALDARLAGVVTSGGEPVLAQLKLAWWRDRLGEDAARWPLGEPLLAALRELDDDWGALLPLVDGWEMLLAEEPGRAQWEEFAAGRAAMWGQVAARSGADGQAAARQGGGWALADLLLMMPAGQRDGELLALATTELASPKRLPRALRPLSVLHGLAARALRGEREALLDGPGAMALAMRLGILGF